MRRVVVTGLGILSPLGIGRDANWSALVEGRSGIRRISHFDPSSFATQIAGQVPAYDPLEHFDAKRVHRLDRFLQFALIAAEEAVVSSGLVVDESFAERAGVYVGSGIGGIQSIEEAKETFDVGGARKISPVLIPRLIINLAPGTISIRYGLKGPSVSHVSACASGTHSIGEAFRAIRYDFADVMVAGGAEAAVTPLSIAGFSSMKALSKRNEDPESASRPFDKDRDGFILSEGAGIVILEELEFARRRGANILCEIVGYGCSSDAFHVAAPPRGGEGAARCIRLALSEGQLAPAEVDYINAHGTSTVFNDLAETDAIKKVFGEEAYRLPVSSTKSMTGHMLGASGAFEAGVIALVMRHGLLPPTINLDEAGEGCDLDYVPGMAREKEVRVALSNSFGFGGMNTTLAFRRYEG